MLDIQNIGADFYSFSKVNGKPLISTTNLSKPQVVIDAISKYYQEINANIQCVVYIR
jgi:cysteine desulfurase/selenocysteine lyase